MYFLGSDGRKRVISQTPGVSERERTLKITVSGLFIVQTGKLRLREGSDLIKITQLVVMRVCQAFSQRTVHLLTKISFSRTTALPGALGKVGKVLELGG